MDLARCAKHLGVGFTMPPDFPVNSTPLLRGCFVAEEAGKLDAYIDAVFNAIWRDGRNLNDLAEFHSVLSELGFDAPAFAQEIQAEPIKARLKELTDEAVSRGAFGSPTIFVGGDEMFFGQDRLDYVERALTAA